MRGPANIHLLSNPILRGRGDVAIADAAIGEVGPVGPLSLPVTLGSPRLVPSNPDRSACRKEPASLYRSSRFQDTALRMIEVTRRFSYCSP